MPNDRYPDNDDRDDRDRDRDDRDRDRDYDRYGGRDDRRDDRFERDDRRRDRWDDDYDDDFEYDYGRRPRQNVPTYLTQAILVTLFCCQIFGIVAIVHAAQAGSKVNVGDYRAARISADKARSWCWAAFKAAQHQLRAFSAE